MLVLIILLSVVYSSSQEPTAFTVVRSASAHFSMEEYLDSISRPKFDTTNNMQVGYNLVSLGGFASFSTYDSLDSELSPIGVWKNIFSIVLGNKATPYANDASEARRYVLDLFHANQSKLLMHVDLTDSPISGFFPISATALGQQISRTLS